MIRDKIKVVFWDLDHTIWKGILAEGDETVIFEDRKRMIDCLNHRGIVNSICSKNDPGPAQERLKELGIWDWFVFPQIAFQPKGEMIKRALEDMNLRSVNALFIDDNEANLKEAEYYNPGISTLNAEELSGDLLSNDLLLGKPDPELSRVGQYKVLEKKTRAKNEAASNNDFLHSCHIKLRLIPYSERYFERLFELSDRTNQLNFTKNRMTRQEFKEMLTRSPEETVLCKVSDDFGDYGIVGFYTLHENTLIHFVFSCRIMNMGVEQFIFDHIGCPVLEVKGNTATEVGTEGMPVPDWIEVSEGAEEPEGSEGEAEAGNASVQKESVRIYGIGACDLFHVVSYFDVPGRDLVYDCNYFKGDERAVNVGTEYIRSSFDMTDEEKEYCREHFYNYTGEDCFSGRILKEKYDYVIMSFHDDMTLKVFRSRTLPNVRVVRTDDTRIAETNLIEDGVFMRRKEQIRYLEENFYPGEFLSEDRFYDNLKWIREKLPDKTVLILITSPEMDFYRKRFPHIPEVREQIIKLNRVIRKVGEEYPDNTGVVEINDIIRGMDDITDYIFHFPAQKSREIYTGIADCMKRFGYKEPETSGKKEIKKRISFNPGGEDWGDDIDIGIKRQYHVSDDPVWKGVTWESFRKEAAGKEIVIFGAGVGLAYYLSTNEDAGRLRVVDNDRNKAGTPAAQYLSLKGSNIEKLMKHPALKNVQVEEVSALKDVDNKDAVVLIANLRYYDDIKEQLSGMGEWKVFSLMQMEARKRGALHD